MQTTEKPRARVNLAERYEREIRSWNWEAIKSDCRENLAIEDNCLSGACYLGSVLHIFPSGKYYMPWCSNQTSFDVVKDSLFQEILESVSEEHGLSVGSGEGDGLDLFAFDYYGEDFLTIDQQGDDTVAFDAWGNEEFRADSESFDKLLAEHMQAEGFFPDLVTVSDHGPWRLVRYSLEN